MFGAPPVGHVMDPQFKPFFLGLWKYVCKCKYVVSAQLVACQKKRNILHMYVRTTMSFGGAVVFPLLVPLSMADIMYINGRL